MSSTTSSMRGTGTTAGGGAAGHETHYDTAYGQSPYTQAAPGVAGTTTGDISRTAQQYGTQAQQAGQQAAGAIQQKASDLSQKATEAAQCAAEQIKATGDRVMSEAKATIRHPSRATPYLIPLLSVLLICGASILPLSLYLGKTGKDKLASAYPRDYGYYSDRGGGWGGEAGAYVGDKLHQAKEKMFGHPSYTDELRYRTDDRSFTDKLLGRRSPADEASYQASRMRDEMEHAGHGIAGHGIGDYFRSAKERVLGGKEAAEETGAGGSEFILQSIDALSDKLHQLRRQYVGRTREEKPTGWMRSTWESIMDGMDRLKYKMMRS